MDGTGMAAPVETPARSGCPCPSWMLMSLWVLPVSFLAVTVRQVEHSFWIVNYHSATYVIMGLFALIVALRFLKRDTLPKRVRAVIDFSAAASLEVALVLLMVSIVADISFASGIACGLIGFGGAWSALRWGEILSGLGTEELIARVFSGQVLNALLMSILGAASVTKSFLVLALLPVISVWAQYRCEGLPAVARKELYTPDLYKGFLGMACGIALYGVVLGLRTYLGYGTFIQPTALESAAVQVFFDCRGLCAGGSRSKKWHNGTASPV